MYATAKWQSTHIHPCPDLHTFSELYLLFPRGLIILQRKQIFIMEGYIHRTISVKEINARV